MAGFTAADITQMLAPWMTGNTFSPTDYGGSQNLGANLLAQSGPSQMPMTTAQRLGLALQGAQQSGLAQAAGRQKVATGGFELQRMMQAWPMIQRMMGQVAGGQQSQQAAAGTTPAAPPAQVPPYLAAAAAQQPPGQPQGAPQQAQQTSDPTSQYMNYAKMSAVAGMGGFPMPGLENYAKLGLANDPTAISQRALAGSPMKVDQMALAQAQGSGDNNGALMAYNKLLTDTGMQHVGSMSGIYTKVETGADPRYPRGSVTTVNPSTGLVVNSEAGASWLPGAAAAVNQRAAAESTGEAQGKLTTVTDKAGNTYQVPMSSLLPNGGRVGAAPAAGAIAPRPVQGGPSTAAPHELGPGAQEMLKGNAQQAVATNKEFQGQAEGGQQMIAQVEELKNAASNFQPGQFAGTRAAFLNYLNSADLITRSQLNSLGSYQAGQKIAIQLQAAATKVLGSREAAQIFQYMGKSLPNLTLSPDGLAKVSAWQEGMASYNIARAAYANNLQQSGDVKGVNQTRDTWIKNSNPLFYVVAKSPPGIQKEFLQAMGPAKAKEFVKQWDGAIQGGFAPPLGQ